MKQRIFSKYTLFHFVSTSGGCMFLSPHPSLRPVSYTHLMMAPQAGEAGLQFRGGVKNISHPWFYGDALRVNQILINILGNAVKFTPPGGNVEFWAEELSPDGKEGVVCYCFTIRDTGIGMSADFLEHVYEPVSYTHLSARRQGGSFSTGERCGRCFTVRK